MVAPGVSGHYMSAWERTPEASAAKYEDLHDAVSIGSFKFEKFIYGFYNVKESTHRRVYLVMGYVHNGACSFSAGTFFVFSVSLKQFKERKIKINNFSFVG